MHNPFASEFMENLITFETSNHFALSDFFKISYNRSFDFCDSLPYLLSQCDASVTSPFSYEVEGLNAFCLIYTKKGEGKLSCEHPTQDTCDYDLIKGTLAFIDCRKKHSLICLHNVWEYTICFVSVPISTYFYQKFETFGQCIFEMDPESLSIWETILSKKEDTEMHGLIRSRELTALYTQLYLMYTMKLRGSYHIPSYIKDMKKEFDTSYQAQYPLEMLSVRYHVNKYRLCREFAKYYGDTPLQYLNKVRIEKAKELLLHSDQTVGAISQAVGIENSNHFIRLFKAKTGMTPLAYRKETPVL